MTSNVRSKRSKQTKEKREVRGNNQGKEEKKTMSSHSDTEHLRRLSICLEVANVRLLETGVEIQVKGDRADREPVWWVVNPSAVFETTNNERYRTITEALDKKRILIAELRPEGDGTLECKLIRIQYAESINR